MLDTQADVSILKSSTLKPYAILNSFNKINIKGVTEEVISSLGSIDINIPFDEYEICQKFHIVDDSFSIPVQGILGKDFIKNNNCVLDYSDFTLTLKNADFETKINILESPGDEVNFIPPRCEVIRHFKSKFKEDIVVLNYEIAPGVFTASTITQGSNSYVRVLNLTNEPKVIPNTIQASPLSEFDFVNQEGNGEERKRNEEIIKIISKNLNDTSPPELISLCSKYNDVFGLETDPMTVNNFYTQTLRVKDPEPVYIKNYRLPHAQKTEIDTQINKLLENDVIEPSHSSYNSPIILVPKKSVDGKKKYRLCIDYRKVNQKLIADKYPLPRIDEILDGLGTAKYFSVIDLVSGFHQIPISKESRDITSFSVPSGSYRWKVLPFGLNVSPNSFSRMMSIAFSGLIPLLCFLYMDDIIVIGRSMRHHLKNLEKIFQTCRAYNLKINPEKCQFFRHEVTYIGHKCTNRGIMPDTTKLSAVKDYPVPKSKDSAKRFVAFANYYRRFIQNFATLAKPINHLTKKTSEFIWTDECQQSFDKLKSSLSSPPILGYPDFTRQFVVTVDASMKGCGAILSQIHDGNDVPVAYASKAFSPAESKKAPIEFELIAVHWAIQHFRPYLYGTHFLVRSDHKPLVHLYSLKDPSSRLTRLRLDLEEYNFTIEHIKGTKNVGADALSRIEFDDIKMVTKQINIITRSVTRKKINKEIPTQKLANQENPKAYEPLNIKYDKSMHTIICNFRRGRPTKEKDLNVHSNAPSYLDFETKIVWKYGDKPVYAFEMNFTNTGEGLDKYLVRLEKVARELQIQTFKIMSDNKLFKWFSINEFKIHGNRVLDKLNIVIVSAPKKIDDLNERKELLEKYHSDPLVGGHAGRNRMYANIRKNYTWKNMTADVAKYVKNCHACQVNKAKEKRIEPMAITTTPQTSFDRCVIDTIGPLTVSLNQNRYAVTIVCDLTKYLIMVPIPNKEAKTVARAIFENVILIFGPVKHILTDCGREYVNEVMDEMCSLLKMSQLKSTAYHHQTLGSIERTHRVFNEYLRAYLESNPDWEENMKYFKFCYNMTPHSTFLHAYSPFELTFGKRPTPFEFTENQTIDPLYNYDNYAKEIRFRLQTAHKQAMELIEKSKLRNKQYYDKMAKPNDFKVSDKILIIDETRHKHEPIYKGPYIIDKINDCNLEIIDINTNKRKIVHKNNARKYLAK